MSFPYPLVSLPRSDTSPAEAVVDTTFTNTTPVVAVFPNPDPLNNDLQHIPDDRDHATVPFEGNFIVMVCTCKYNW